MKSVDRSGLNQIRPSSGRLLPMSGGSAVRDRGRVPSSAGRWEVKAIVEGGDDRQRERDGKDGDEDENKVRPRETRRDDTRRGPRSARPAGSFVLRRESPRGLRPPRIGSLSVWQRLSIAVPGRWLFRPWPLEKGHRRLTSRNDSPPLRLPRRPKNAAMTRIRTVLISLAETRSRHARMLRIRCAPGTYTLRLVHTCVDGRYNTYSCAVYLTAD